jgi:hypothetical protein
MTNPNFQAILSKPAGEAERPKPLPVGSFLGLISGFEFKESSKQKTPFVQYKVKPQQALEDVDPALLEGIDLTSKELKVDFYLTEEALYRLDEFLKEHCGISIEGLPYDQAIGKAVNSVVGFTIKHETDQRDPKIVYSKIGTTFKPAA